MKLRVIFWTVTMGYTGFLMANRGVPVFNSLTITEALLGAMAGFFLAIMFTLRSIRKQRPLLISHSIAHMAAYSSFSSPDRGSRPKLKR